MSELMEGISSKGKKIAENLKLVWKAIVKARIDLDRYEKRMKVKPKSYKRLILLKKFFKEELEKLLNKLR